MLFKKKRIFMLERDNFKYLKFFSTLNKALRYQDSSLKDWVLHVERVDDEKFEGDHWINEFAETRWR